MNFEMSEINNTKSKSNFETRFPLGGREVGPFGLMMAGGLAGVMSWIVTFPIG